MFLLGSGHRKLGWATCSTAKTIIKKDRQTHRAIGLDWRDCFDQSHTAHWSLRACIYRDIVFALKPVERTGRPHYACALPLNTTPWKEPCCSLNIKGYCKSEQSCLEAGQEMVNMWTYIRTTCHHIGTSAERPDCLGSQAAWAAVASLKSLKSGLVCL